LKAARTKVLGLIHNFKRGFKLNYYNISNIQEIRHYMVLKNIRIVIAFAILGAGDIESEAS